MEDVKHGDFADKVVDNIDDVVTAEKGGSYESKAELERLYKIHGPEGLDEDGHPKRTGTVSTFAHPGAGPSMPCNQSGIFHEDSCSTQTGLCMLHL